VLVGNGHNGSLRDFLPDRVEAMPIVASPRGPHYRDPILVNHRIDSCLRGRNPTAAAKPLISRGIDRGST
jgi:hypothetical protein